MFKFSEASKFLHFRNEYFDSTIDTQELEEELGDKVVASELKKAKGHILFAQSKFQSLVDVNSNELGGAKVVKESPSEVGFGIIDDDDDDDHNKKTKIDQHPKKVSVEDPDLIARKFKKGRNKPKEYYDHAIEYRTETQDYWCLFPKCPRNYKSPSVNCAKDHVRKQHPNFIPPTYVDIISKKPDASKENICYLCPEATEFKTRKDYTSHVYKCHHTREPYKCTKKLGESLCDFEEDKIRLYKDHLKYHQKFDNWIKNKKLIYTKGEKGDVSLRLLTYSDFNKLYNLWSGYVRDKKYLYSGFAEGKTSIYQAVVTARAKKSDANSCRIKDVLSDNGKIRMAQFNEKYAFHLDFLTDSISVATKLKNIIRHLNGSYSHHHDENKSKYLTPAAFKHLLKNFRKGHKLYNETTNKLIKKNSKKLNLIYTELRAKAPSQK